MSLTYSLILIFISAVGLIISGLKDTQKTARALQIAGKRFLDVLPFLIAVFLLTGLLEVFVSSKTIVMLMGSTRGLLAPVFAALIGGVLTGPPAASYPMTYFLLHHGASWAAAATFLIAWVAVGTVSLPIEIRLLGARFAWTRWILTLVFSIVIGVLIGWFM